MTVPVSYYCPRCGAVVELEREGYLADKAVTPYPFEGWSYAAPDESFEEAEGVRFVCGAADGPVSWRPADALPEGAPAEAVAATAADDDGDEDRESDDGDQDAGLDAEAVGCGEPFYLSFVRFEESREVDPRRPGERVELGLGDGPAGPRGPSGPDGPRFG